MKIKTTVLALSFVLTPLLNPVFAVEKEKKPENSYQQDMIQLGAYLYGINQERSKSAPNRDEISFLADSMLEIINHLKPTRRIHHENIELLKKQLQNLKEAKTLKKSLQAADEVSQSCGGCHRGAKPLF